MRPNGAKAVRRRSNSSANTSTICSVSGTSRQSSRLVALRYVLVPGPPSAIEARIVTTASRRSTSTTVIASSSLRREPIVAIPTT